MSQGKVKPPSADFNSFAEAEDQDNTGDYEYDIGFIETDRIDVQSSIDPNALVYSQNSAPYGEQFPSYVPKNTIQTMVGTMGNQDSSKSVGTGDNVVYGKFPEGADASKAIAEYYDDQFEYFDDYEYYEEDALKDLKEQLGIAGSASQTKMSFLQLLQNLQSN